MSWLSFHTTQCCGFQELSGLSMYLSNPKQAMLDFCESVLTRPVKYGSYTARPDALYSFYLFSAAVTTGSIDRSGCYGAQFAKFIEDNNLGTITASPVKVNAGWHPNHSNQIWLWGPDVKALRAWYDATKLPSFTPVIKVY